MARKDCQAIPLIGSSLKANQIDDDIFIIKDAIFRLQSILVQEGKAEKEGMLYLN